MHIRSATFGCRECSVVDDVVGLGVGDPIVGLDVGDPVGLGFGDADGVSVGLNVGVVRVGQHCRGSESSDLQFQA